MNRDSIAIKDLRKDEIFEVLEFEEEEVDEILNRSTSVQAMMRSLRVD